MNLIITINTILLHRNKNAKKKKSVHKHRKEILSLFIYFEQKGLKQPEKELSLTWNQQSTQSELGPMLTHTQVKSSIRKL